VVDIEYLDEDAIANVLVTIFGNTQFAFEPRTRTLVFRAPAASADDIAGVIAALDVEPSGPDRPSLEVTAHILIATRTPAPGGDIPDELAGVVEGLQTRLPYGSYNLLETAIARVAAGGRLWMEGVLPGFSSEAYRAGYSLEATVDLDPGGGPPRVRIDDLTFLASVGVSDAARSLQMRTSVDMPPDAPIVAGKASAADAALILVMRAALTD
jgi:hypothetical protein